MAYNDEINRLWALLNVNDFEGGGIRTQELGFLILLDITKHLTRLVLQVNLDKYNSDVQAHFMNEGRPIRPKIRQKKSQREKEIRTITNRNVAKEEPKCRKGQKR